MKNALIMIAAAIAAFVVASNFAGNSNPSIDFKPKLDLGELADGLHSVKLDVENTGEEEVIVEIASSSCSCVKAAQGSLKLEVGEIAQIEFAVSVERQQTEVNEELLLSCRTVGGGGNRIYPLRIFGAVVSSLVLSPPNVFFDDQDQRQVVSISVGSDDLQIENIASKSSLPFVGVGEVIIGADEKVAELILKSTSFPPGEFEGVIDLLIKTRKGQEFSRQIIVGGKHSTPRGISERRVLIPREDVSRNPPANKMVVPYDLKFWDFYGANGLDISIEVSLGRELTFSIDRYPDEGPAFGTLHCAGVAEGEEFVLPLFVKS